MVSKTMAIAVSTLLLLPVTLTRKSFADSIEKLATESLPDTRAGYERVEMEMPIPNTPEMDQNDAAATTLELRLANTACPRLAQWVELTSKCEIVSPERPKLRARMISHSH